MNNQELIEFDENNIEHLAELDRLVREGHEWAKVLGPKCDEDELWKS